MGEDMMVEMVPWRHPLKHEASVLTLAEPGGSSKERDVQKEREKNVLAVLVFDQNNMDESPKEPDLEELTFTYVAPRLIPLEDSTSQSAQSEQVPAAAAEQPALLQPAQPAAYSEQQSSGQLPPVLASMIPPTQPTTPTPLPAGHPPPLPMPLPDMLPHPDQFPVMPVQQYPPPQLPPMPPQPAYNTYNPDTRNFHPSHDRNGRDQSKRGDNNWNYRKGGHGERHYRDWVEMDRRNYGTDRADRPPRERWVRMCAFYNTKQGCRDGDNCRFVHEKGGHHGRREEGGGDRKRGDDVKEGKEKSSENTRSPTPVK